MRWRGILIKQVIARVLQIGHKQFQYCQLIYQLITLFLLPLPTISAYLIHSCNHTQWHIQLTIKFQYILVDSQNYIEMNMKYTQFSINKANGEVHLVIIYIEATYNRIFCCGNKEKKTTPNLTNCKKTMKRIFNNLEKALTAVFTCSSQEIIQYRESVTNLGRREVSFSERQEEVPPSSICNNLLSE